MVDETFGVKYKPWSILKSQGVRDMRIGELAGRSGLSIDTIRFYEKRGLLGAQQVGRSANGYRSYSDETVERLALIRQAQGAGFSLSEIVALLGLWDKAQLDDEQIVAFLRTKRNQIAQRIAELERMQHYLDQKLQQYENTRS
jgi:MerR family transcriptional regulator, copper efflux regulator